MTPAFQVLGNSIADSLALDQRQWEDNYFGILSLQKHYSEADFQVSLFSRYSQLDYQPDPMGDLMFNGISPWANRQSLANGMQGDGSWKLAVGHTLRGGFLVQRERATTQTNAQVLPVDATGAQTTDVPQGILFGSDEIGWLYGVYLQDEWKVTPTVTINFGARFDAYNYTIHGEPAQPAHQRRVAAQRLADRPCRLRALLHAAAARPGQHQWRARHARHDGPARGDYQRHGAGRARRTISTRASR